MFWLMGFHPMNGRATAGIDGAHVKIKDDIIIDLPGFLRTNKCERMDEHGDGCGDLVDRP